MKSFRRQKGHAALIVVIVVPALWGLMSLSLDGSRALQDKARIDDALEAATLAVAARNDPNDHDPSDPDSGYISLGQGSKTNQTIAKAYLTNYLTDLSDIVSIDIDKHSCEEVPECLAGLKKGKPRYYQYTISATTKHDTWLPNESTLGDSFNVSSSGKAIKYQSSAIDIVLVSDFSGSMYNNWSGTKRKYLNIVDIVKAVTDELQIYNSLENMEDSYVAYVGYNRMTSNLVSTKNVYFDGKWYNRTLCMKEPVWFNTYSFTSDDIFKPATSCKAYQYAYVDNTEKVLRTRSTNSNYNSYPFYFYDLPLTTDYTTFNRQIANFYPSHGTSSYQGLVRGAQLAEAGVNPRRLIIVLSDGKDNYTYITRRLVDRSLCTKITDHLNTLKADPDGDGNFEDVVSTIAVIGFDYNLDQNTALRDCVGTSNIYKANDEEEILDRILELISDEFGYLAN